MRVTVFGGCGYVGARLVPQLLESGHEVRVYDAQYFGANLNFHTNLEIVQGDVRDISAVRKSVQSADSVIHLACLSNDASFELSPALSQSINFDSFEPLVVASKAAGVKRFIYASSSSVYGVSDAPDVLEDHPLVPLTLYNSLKADCEPLLLKYKSDDFVCTVIRPATVCGYSPRMRLDLSVNILTNHAVTNRKILVFGGQQTRPNLHIQDMCDVYRLMLEAPAEKINGEIFNVGRENLSISDIANKVKTVVEEMIPGNTISIEFQPSKDKRSYHVNSDKIANVLGFKPCYSVEQAIWMMVKAFLDGKIPDSMTDSKYFNVERMKTTAHGGTVHLPLELEPNGKAC